MAAKRDFLRLVVDRGPTPPRVQGVYLITDHDERLVERVQEAINGGVGIVQFRYKKRDDVEKYRLAQELKQLCGRTGALLIINDDLKLAQSVDADGLHLGQDDGDLAEARRLLGPRKLLGVSTHSLEEAAAAEAAGADYIGCGAMYPTASKEIDHLVGPELLRQIRPHVRVPIIAIGGITRDNAAAVIDAGADAIAVISAVMGHPEPALAAGELQLLFNRQREFPRGSVLTVAGSDSGGGAGIQADLKTVTLLGSYAASVITALTAQNTRGVSGIHGVPPEFVADQLDAVLTDIPVDVVKTGMLYSAEIIAIVADRLRSGRRRLAVVDPVMVAKGGANLIDAQAIAVLQTKLLPLTYLLTPNIPEAERLTGLAISNEEGMQQAARLLHQMGVRNVLIKGGHLPDGTALDILFDGQGFHRYASPRILTKNSHGTGCTLSAAIATFLAQGEPLPVAIGRAKEFITDALRLAQPLGKGHGPVNHYLATLELRARESDPGTQQ
jgi:hydroxymethylpyrimidine kinase/phosphomethylpyrimidine kinase/thiamine-phosphate diphosphorylase